MLNRSPDTVLRALPALVDLARRPEDTRLLWAWSASAQYPVLLRDGLLADPADGWPADGRRFLVTDGAVGRLFADRLEPLAGRVSIMPGEQSKTVAHAEIVWTELVRAGLTRTDHVVALGGGVVGDLAGFCAATYQRGVPIVHVPTTVVAQVDSAYGGKTGVDLAEAKNYVGAYHQPAAVLVDPETLHTLPPQERAAGYAEVVKTALIAGGRLWDRVRVGASVTDDGVIAACALTKLRVVAQDERDDGRRQVLNLGHTVAHAIETATGYARYRHGEAVGLGLLAALRLSGLDDLREEVGELLEAAGLPTALEADVDAVLQATARDKKRVGEGPVPFVARARARRRAPGRRAPGPRSPRRRDRVGGRARMSTAHNRIQVMHGVNLDMLGRRDPDTYGTLSLTDLEREVSEMAAELGLQTRFFQTNFEGEFVEELHRLDGLADGILLNPGRVDPLRVGDPRRAGDRGPAGGRGPPLRRGRARGLAQAHRSSATCAWPASRARAWTGTARRSSGCARRCRERARRRRRRRRGRARARRPARGRGVQPALADRLHGHQRAGPGRRRPARVPDRLPLRRAGRGRGRPGLRPPPRASATCSRTGATPCPSAARSSSASTTPTRRCAPTAGCASCSATRSSSWPPAA